MDNISLQRFNYILLKPIEVLNQDEISFLKARSGALTDEQLAKYADILNPIKEITSEPEEKKTKSTKGVKSKKLN